MKYTALTPIKHDGKDHAVGDTLSLDGKEAKGLLDVGAIEPAGGRGKADKADADAQAKADAEAAAKAQAEAQAQADAEALAQAEATARNGASQ